MSSNAATTSCFASSAAVLSAAPRRAPPLAPHEIHLWAFTLDDPLAFARSNALLSEDERTRAQRFVHGDDRMHYVIAHGALRCVLAAYAGADPSALTFAAQRDGKPALAGYIGDRTSLQFNLAHAHGRALIAVSRDRAIGVDLEYDDADIDGHDVADAYFNPIERDRIRRVSRALRRQAFLRYWVAKEAVLKAHGAGFSLSPTAFAVRFARDGRSASIASAPVELGADWRVQMLQLGAQWFGALAARGEAWTVLRAEASIG